eukprot:TRINITY_DN665_c0_g1_i1.p1 TRINITY_DN665_c0_g1~~TRINITY_DN665_c0_g1_i1.p1  ORF type:complete len:564 (-),score=240.32 TRINITY_DN665_c0_g1_i1:14-1705(-)
MSRRGTPTHMLKVGIVSAKYLKQTNSWNVGSDAYADVRVSCSPTEKKTTSVIKQSTAPEWGETFDFVLSDNPADDILLVQVNGQKSLSSPSFIGRVEIPLTLLLHQMPVDGWYRLLPQYSFPGVASKSPPRIRLRLHYYYLAANGLPQMPQFVNGNNAQNVPGQFNRAAFPPTVMARAPGVVGTVTMPGTVTGGMPMTMTRNNMPPSSSAALINNNNGGSRGATFPCPFCQKKFTESEINQHAERCIETGGGAGGISSSRDVASNGNSSSRSNGRNNNNSSNNGGFSSSLSDSADDEDGLTSSLERLSTSSPSSNHRHRSNTTPSSTSSNTTSPSYTGTSLSNFVNNSNNNNRNNNSNTGAYPSLREFDNNNNSNLNNNNNMNTNMNNNNATNTNTTSSHAARMEMLSSMEQALPPQMNNSNNINNNNMNNNGTISFPSFPSIPSSSASLPLPLSGSNLNTGMNTSMHGGIYGGGIGGNIPVVYPYYEAASHTQGGAPGGMYGGGMDLPPQYNVAVGGYNNGGAGGMYNGNMSNGVGGGNGGVGGNGNISGGHPYTLDSLLDN